MTNNDHDQPAPAATGETPAPARKRAAKKSCGPNGHDPGRTRKKIRGQKIRTQGRGENRHPSRGGGQ